MTALPPTRLVRRQDTHRLIPSQYSVLARIAGDDAQLRDLFDLDNATNERLQAEAGLLPGIGIEELVFGIPFARIVNAAFVHAHPLGSRFNGPERGAWYAGFELETSMAEVAHHKAVQYAEIGRFDDVVTYDDYLADIAGEFHDLRAAPVFADCLDPDSYVASQALAERVLEAEGLGIVYPSVRRAGGTCLAVFRPALVSHVRRDTTWRFAWTGSPVPEIGRA
ncbi:RES family NAD+ phosphorylase [Paracraurococcus lichenis]|uniref:RES family NAD+ phosphorylase n=1 Tax=Paracraurococcus lichenis TaxID=3064888 RepID=A0ABT9E310_9PROT|nr:RES family NAD+ phosphorylase [Paracraurococcus sp. LOR1-02]MDO9710487.1 RES family NAD+ phosphorylase [Paracraurococcus sp. LOR1-02]